MRRPVYIATHQWAGLLLAALVSCDDPAPVVIVRAEDLARPVVADLTAPAVAVGQPVQAPTPTPTMTGADPIPAGLPKAALFVRSSRCGECHEKFRTEWAQTSHASANRSPAFRQAMGLVSASTKAFCQSCHLPSLSAGQPDEEPNRPSEGVACDGCHTLSQVTLLPGRAEMKFDPGSGKKYGPIVGASGHYFHDMAYSELHAKSELCAGCHHLQEITIDGQKRQIPVLSDYLEWQKFGKGKSCQDCHMPSRGTEPVARGSQPRMNVPSHGFPGAAVLGKQVRMEVSVRGKPAELHVDLSHNAGHAIPAGFVDRRLLLRIDFQGADGRVLATEERWFGTKLVDAAGLPVPFFRAQRVAESRRIFPGKAHTEILPVPAAASAATKAVCSLVSAQTAPELTSVYGEPRTTVLKSVTIPLPVHAGGSK